MKFKHTFYLLGVLGDVNVPSDLISVGFQLMENAAFTFEQLLYRTFEDKPDNAGSTSEKAKHRVLKVRASLRSKQAPGCVPVEHLCIQW